MTDNTASDNTADKQNSENSASATKLDIRALMTEIRSRVKEEATKNKDSVRPFVPKKAEFENADAKKAGELVYSEDLRFLNLNYGYSASAPLEAIVTHRGGVLGKVIVKFKQKLLSFVWNLFAPSFQKEREFQSHLVRYLNDVSRYVDSRDASNFWELIRKIDYDITKALDRVERIRDDVEASIASSEKRLQEVAMKDLHEVKAASAQHAEELKTIDSVVRGLEAITALAGRAPKVPEASGGTVPNVEPNTDYSYLLLENRFRGSESDIQNRLSIYVNVFEKTSAPVLEIGGGRGELQELFQKSSIKSYAIDLDKAMVETCAKKGLPVQYGDGIAHLAGVKDASLGGVIAIQVVEHLTQEQLQSVVALCTQKVVKGGRIVFETINPRSVLALSSNYFRDPTHVWPLHPDTLGYTMQLGGLKIIETKMLSPVSDESKLRSIQIGEHMTPKWATTVDAFNHNIRQLNDLLYGYQDYCIIAEV